MSPHFAVRQSIVIAFCHFEKDPPRESIQPYSKSPYLRPDSARASRHQFYRTLSTVSRHHWIRIRNDAAHTSGFARLCRDGHRLHSFCQHTLPHGIAYHEHVWPTLDRVGRRTAESYAAGKFCIRRRTAGCRSFSIRTEFHIAINRSCSVPPSRNLEHGFRHRRSEPAKRGKHGFGFHPNYSKSHDGLPAAVS